MNLQRPRLAAFAALSLPFLAVPRAPVGDVAFAVAEGASVAKRFEVEGSLVLDDLYLTFNGEEADASSLGMPADMEVSFGYSLGCTDTYEAMGSGRPEVLLRAYEEMTGWWNDQDGNGEEESKESVEGKSVKFAWSDELDGYEKSFVDEDGDEDDLAPLAEDLDLRGLLPEGDESSWSVGGEELLAVLLPGIDLGNAMDSDDEVPDEVVEALEGLFEALEAELVLGSSVEEDGVELATFNLASAIDETKSLDAAAFLDSDESESLSWDRFDATVSLELEGEGLWNTGVGRFESFETKADGTLVIDFAFGVPDYGLEIEGTVEFAVELSQSAEASDA